MIAFVLQIVTPLNRSSPPLFSCALSNDAIRASPACAEGLMRSSATRWAIARAVSGTPRARTEQPRQPGDVRRTTAGLVMTPQPADQRRLSRLGTTLTGLPKRFEHERFDGETGGVDVVVAHEADDLASRELLNFAAHVLFHNLLPAARRRSSTA